MKILAVITSRYNSKRLPGKALQYIGSKPLIQWVYDRVSPCADETVVATTTESQPIIIYCYRHGLNCFVSDNHFVEEENLIHRLVKCGDTYDMETVLRIWGDCPFLDPALIERGIHYFKENRLDYLYPQGLTKGLSFTIYKHSSFVRLFHKMNEGDKWYWNYVDELKGWKEHGFSVGLLDYGMALERLRGLNINTLDDLKDAQNAVERYGDNVSYKNLIEMYGGKLG